MPSSAYYLFFLCLAVVRCSISKAKALHDGVPIAFQQDTAENQATKENQNGEQNKIAGNEEVSFGDFANIFEGIGAGMKITALLMEASKKAEERAARIQNTTTTETSVTAATAGTQRLRNPLRSVANGAAGQLFPQQQRRPFFDFANLNRFNFFGIPSLANPSATEANNGNALWLQQDSISQESSACQQSAFSVNSKCNQGNRQAADFWTEFKKWARQLFGL